MSCPVAAGSLSVPIGLKMSSVVPAKLASGTIAASGTVSNGDKFFCVNAQFKKQAETQVTGMPDCSTATCSTVCTCVESNCANLYDACVADSQCSGILTCMLGCACDDAVCSLGCVAGQTLDSVSS